MSVQAPSRLTPIGRVTPFRAQRIWEKNFIAYRRLWKVVVSGFFEPVFYLFAVGIGVGALVGDVTLPGGEAVSYAAFVAPAMMAASAMNGSVIETTFNIFFKLQFGKVYEGILTTPMQPMDIAIGEIGWALLRGLLYSTAFVGVMFALGMTTTWWAILAIPAATLIGFAFGSVGLAAATWMKSWQDFDLVTLATMPLFLFSASFFPIDVYPPAVATAVKVLSPLYHGNELLRGFTLGMIDWTMLGHAAYLLIMGLIGAAVASRRLDGMLRK